MPEAATAFSNASRLSVHLVDDLRRDVVSILRGFCIFLNHTLSFPSTGALVAGRCSFDMGNRLQMRRVVVMAVIFVTNFV